MGLKPDLSWWKPATWRNDPLYNEIAFGSSGMLYFLGHHTFNHENLNNVTYWDALQQIRLNQVRWVLQSLRCAQPASFGCLQQQAPHGLPPSPR